MILFDLNLFLILCLRIDASRIIGLILDLKLTLRECVEKLQLLKTPEERQRRMEDIPEIHADPNMDPSFESEEEEETDNKRQGPFHFLLNLQSLYHLMHRCVSN